MQGENFFSEKVFPLRILVFTIHNLLECRDFAEGEGAEHCEDAFGEHVGAVVEEGVEVGVHVGGSPDGYAGDVVAFEAEEDGEEGADEDAFGAFVPEKAGDAEDGEGEYVVGEDADDEDDRRETPAEDSAGEEAEDGVDEGGAEAPFWSVEEAYEADGNHAEGGD